METRFMLYGSTGFVGETIARQAVQHGLRPIIAGRNAAKIEAQRVPREPGGVVRGHAVPSGLLKGFAHEVHLGRTGELGERPSPQDGLFDGDPRQQIGEAASKPLRGCEEGFLVWVK